MSTDTIADLFAPYVRPTPTHPATTFNEFYQTVLDFCFEITMGDEAAAREMAISITQGIEIAVMQPEWAQAVVKLQEPHDEVTYGMAAAWPRRCPVAVIS